jgi:hypothetical protein
MSNLTTKERLSVVENEVKNVKATVDEVKTDVKSVIKKLDNLENVYVTRREVALVKAAIGVLASLFAIYAAVKGLKRG